MRGIQWPAVAAAAQRAGVAIGARAVRLVAGVAVRFVILGVTP